MCPEMKFTSSSFGYVKIWCKYLFLCQTSYCQTSKCNKFWNHWVLYEIWVISSINSYTMYNIHFGNLVQFNIDQVVDNVHLFTGVWVACVGIEPSKKLEEIDHVMMHLETFVLFELETKKHPIYYSSLRSTVRQALFLYTLQDKIIQILPIQCYLNQKHRSIRNHFVVRFYEVSFCFGKYKRFL